MTEKPFALLTHRTWNLGDDIQTASVMHWLGRGVFVNRDDSSHWPPVRVVLAGWWLGTKRFPPPDTIEALPVGMHWQRGSAALLERVDVARWFHAQTERWGEPIGARDVASLELFERCGIPARLTGCVTLTLPKYNGPRTGIVLIDVPRFSVEDSLHRLDSPMPVIRASQASRELRTCPPEVRLARAVQRLSLLQRAQAVLTTRLHVLLPCVAFGTPVLFFPPRYQPERFRDYAGLASATFPLEQIGEAVEATGVLAGRLSPPQAVPEFSQELCARLAMLRREWRLGATGVSCF